MIKLQRNLFEGNYPLSQLFGQNPDWYAPFGLKGHNGLDYAVPTGTKLFSCINGTVIEAQLDKTGYGNYIKIENDTCGVLYGHLSKFLVKVGDNVKAGDLIGLSGNTGNSTGPHLHFGVFPKPRDRQNGYAGYINPLDTKLIEWVDDLDFGGNESDKKIQELQKELDEMRDSRNEWRNKYKTLEESLSELQKQLDVQKEHVSSLQKSQSELNLQNSNLKSDITRLEYEIGLKVSDIETLKSENSSLESGNNILRDKINALEGQITALENSVTKANEDLAKEKEKSKKKLSNYSKMELFLAIFRR